MKKTSGFTLLELLIVVVIVGTLLGISVPAFQQYTLRSHRADAHAALLDIASRQERYLAQRNAYSLDIAGANGLNMGTTESSEGYYNISVQSCGSGISSCYRLTASAIGSQVNDTECRDITYDSLGTKGGTTDECW